MIKSASIWSFPSVLFAVSFGLNWIWEILQMFAYQVKPTGLWTHILLYCTSATVIDASVTIGSYALAAMITRNREIGSGWKPYAIMALFGAIWAVIFELAGKRFGLWSYSELMPMVPIIKVGLVPLLQLAILMPVALLITVWRLKEGKKEI